MPILEDETEEKGPGSGRKTTRKPEVGRKPVKKGTKEFVAPETSPELRDAKLKTTSRNIQKRNPRPRSKEVLIFDRAICMERCLSGRKSTIGNRVCPEKGIEGSNPSLSAKELKIGETYKG